MLEDNKKTVLVKYDLDGKAKEIELECEFNLPMEVGYSYEDNNRIVLKQLVKYLWPNRMFYELIEDSPRGSRGQRMKNSRELMQMHGIDRVSYILDKCEYSI